MNETLGSRTCAAYLAAGEPCTNVTLNLCAPWTYCRFEDSSGAPGACTPYVAAGQPCRKGWDVCGRGTLCVLDPVSGAPTCGRLPAEGVFLP